MFLVRDLFLTSVPITVHLQVWNSVGIVRCHTEDEISSIEVEFHDTSTHHPLHLTNHLNHTMAALSSTAVLLACKAHEDSPRYCTVILNNPFYPKVCISGIHTVYHTFLIILAFKQAIAPIIIHQLIYLVHSWSKYNKMIQNAQVMYSK